MCNKSSIVIPILLVFLGGLISVCIGSPHDFCRSTNLRENTVQKFHPAEEVSSIQQEEGMKPTPPPDNQSDSQDLIRDQKNTSWRIYTKSGPQFSYRVEYPSEWTVEESGNAAFFMPSHLKSKYESISIVVINYKETPPLPVRYAYTTIRTVHIDAEEILVRKREPSPVTEKYFAEIKKGNYTAEFRFSLDSQHDDVFDHMLSTFVFVE